jgi:hypothetical protein
MLDLMTLQQMRNVDINTIAPDDVTDVSDINIDINQSVKERMASYINQVKNPYFIKVGKLIVKMEFSNTDISLNDCFERYMKIC